MTQLMNTLRPAVKTCMVAARLPGLVVTAARGGVSLGTLALGADASGAPLDAGSPFIVASVTKLATALVLLRLIDAGDAQLDDPLTTTLPEAAAAQPGVTLRRLLSHTAGLPPDVNPERAPYRAGLDWPTIARACLATELRDAPGTLVQYGNVSYGLLALVAERLARQPFPALLQDLVLRPLGITGVLGAEPARPATQLADVRGRGNNPELAPFHSPFYRSLALPWAGLVTDAAGALALVEAFAGRPAGFISPALLAEAASDQTGGLAGGAIAPLWWPRCPWGLGPDIKGEKQPHWSPPNASATSFGHAGQSGCIVWHDPALDISYAILGARTADSGWLLRHAATLGAAILAL